jgi:hypothetical protein
MLRDDMDLEVVAVESLKDKLAKRLDEARSKGRFVDICDSNDITVSICTLKAKGQAKPGPCG